MEVTVAVAAEAGAAASGGLGCACHGCWQLGLSAMGGPERTSAESLTGRLSGLTRYLRAQRVHIQGGVRY